ncbi:hypothetical protein VSH64_14025 [Amycolatopsis rhabdoformis]|uniref:Uncharacterized protein n=1 Tax=Amycolatopsis rhabdoformis TaxID=1448059 RepID=A0ABZ1IG35_9PSEU|nr:hypothetical protein [Amycolatopsis rhabdoformis]WSE33217.1 hypothetical protein VSH64_14025 [Amycolatopsis rhabdoformis]
MEHVIVEATKTGNHLDPTAYLNLLPTLADALPPGARAFATDPDHYDFYSTRCVKDLTLDTLQHGDTDGEGWLRLGFRHNCWKHEEDLSLRYTGVRGLDLGDFGPSRWSGIGALTLDEILPHEHGFSHQIDFRAGSLTVVSRDLAAKWTPADDCRTCERGS